MLSIETITHSSSLLQIVLAKNAEVSIEFYSHKMSPFKYKNVEFKTTGLHFGPLTKFPLLNFKIIEHCRQCSYKGTFAEKSMSNCIWDQNRANFNSKQQKYITISKFPHLKSRHIHTFLSWALFVSYRKISKIRLVPFR